MAAKDNAGFLQQLTQAWSNMTGYNPELQRQMDLRDAARNRGETGGKMDEGGLPKISLPEWLAGIKGPEGQIGIQRQQSANNTSKIVQGNFASNPSLFNIDRTRLKGEDDLSYNSRILSTQDSRIAVQKAIDEGIPEALLKSDTQLTPAQVQDISKKYTENQKTIDLIRNETFGPELLAAEREKAGGMLNADQLAGVLATARSKDPELVSRLDTAKTTRDVASGRLQLERESEANDVALANSKIQHANEVLDYNWRTGNADRDYKWRSEQADRDYRWRSDEADREQRKVLTMLGLEDKGDARRERSEERQAQNQQLFILQLMKGLSGLGQSFGGY